MSLILDAYNVLHCSHLLPDRHAMVSATGLCQLLDRSKLHAGRVTVVCDGRPKPQDELDADLGAVSLVYSGPKRSADDVIEDLIERDNSPRDLVVVSNDRRLRSAARRRRARPMASEVFVRLLARALAESTRPVSEQPPPDFGDTESWLKAFGYDGGNDEGLGEEQIEAETTNWLQEFGFDTEADA
ncbi:MAG: NYN domain-containing protein [Phycisphaerae bacterium]|nr:NYN domain-containing protein [Phycisphaerae bacterium]